jgi:hypothetical protein
MAFNRHQSIRSKIMQNLIFNRAQVETLLAHSKNAAERLPTLEQLFDPRHRKDGKAPAEDHWPDIDEVDIATIPYGLWLVADHGIYLMSNARQRDIVDPGANRSRVAYAEGVNADTDDFDTWWENKRLYMGGDDQGLFIDGQEIEAQMAIDPQGSQFVIGVQTNGMYVTHTQLLRAIQPVSGEA